MFSALLNKAITQIAVVRKCVEFSDLTRKQLAIAKADSDFAELKLNAPQDIGWRIYDHCAAVTRLYAIYESFVEELLTDVLSVIPEMFTYKELKEDFRRHHRNGIAHVLEKIEKRYKKLDAAQVIQDFNAALTGATPYTVLPQAMLRHDENLRLDILTSIFDRFDIPNVGGWLHQHRSTKDYFKYIRGEQNTVDAELVTFIQYRNDAAHGYVDEGFGKEQLLVYCGFMEALCRTLYERSNHWALSRKITLCQADKLGNITEEFRRVEAAIITVANATVTVGDRLFIQGNYYCYPATITSIQDNGKSQKSVTTVATKELGIRADVPLYKYGKVFRLLA
jgi:hypothetical protein